jgi:SAM-dependent methyltransferase
MLEEHLSQAHDAASRRSGIIDRQVQWIHREVLSTRPSRILDLGCGPGLYSQRLAALGHNCTGIDYSPASIAYAKDQANKERLAIRYEQEDIRRADFPDGQDLVMLISGELNVFSVSDARGLVGKAAGCLAASGKLILEVHAPGVLRRQGEEPPSWYSSRSGLWSGSAHICLQENFWDAESSTATTRYFVIDAATGKTKAESATYQDYSDDEYDALLVDAGFKTVKKYPSLTGVADEQQRYFTVRVASK